MSQTALFSLSRFDPFSSLSMTCVVLLDTFRIKSVKNVSLLHGTWHMYLMIVKNRSCCCLSAWCVFARFVLSVLNGVVLLESCLLKTETRIIRFVMFLSVLISQYAMCSTFGHFSHQICQKRNFAPWHQKHVSHDCQISHFAFVCSLGACLSVLFSQYSTG